MSTTNLEFFEEVVKSLEGVKLENLYNSIMEKKERFQFKKSLENQETFSFRVSTNTEEFKEARAAVVKKFWGLE